MASVEVDPRVRTGLTLGVLGLLLVVAVSWGWNALTEPLPAADLSAEDAPVCVESTVEAGSRIRPGDVVVSVFNGGTTAGLAGRTLTRLARRGFVVGESGNAGERVRRVQVWTEDRRSPAVRLVRTHLAKRVRIVEREGLGPGVTVVVGDEFDRLKPGRRQFPVRQDTTICTPPSE